MVGKIPKICLGALDTDEAVESAIAAAEAGFVKIVSPESLPSLGMGRRSPGYVGIDSDDADEQYHLDNPRGPQ